MNDSSHPISRRIVRARGQMIRQRAWALLPPLLLAASLLSLLWSAWCVWQGQAVGLRVHLLLIILLLPLWALLTWLGRPDHSDAARALDQAHSLRDSISSWLAFRPRAQDPYVRLQEQRTLATLTAHGPTPLRRPLPRRQWTAALLLMLLASSSSLIPESSAQAALRAEAERISDTSAHIQQRLRALLDEIEEDARDEQERNLISGEALRELIEQLQITGDLGEALRQLAEIEIQVASAQRRLDQRQQQRILQRAGEELRGSDLLDLRRLGRNLREGRLDEARQGIEALNQDSTASFQERERAAMRLRDASRRMARANQLQPQPSQQTENPQRQSAMQQESAEQREGGQLTENLDRLNQASEELLSALEQMDQEMGQCPDGNCSAESQQRAAAAGEKANQQLQGLARGLAQMDAQQRAQARLQRLQQALAQSQSALSEGSSMLAQSQQAGGQEAGQGSVEQQREASGIDPASAGGMQLHGQRGEGPSQRVVEDASSGHGVSQLRHQARQTDFRRQAEAFVQREDIPDDLREGVRNYFSSLAEQPALSND